jgi:hypothetical protein
LDSEDGTVRESAVAALVSIGIDGIELILHAVTPQTTEQQWSGVKSALTGMGAEKAAETLRKLSGAWPPHSARRILELEKVLSEPSGGVKEPNAARSPLEEEVDAILKPLETQWSYGSNHPAVRRLVGLGRGAFQLLMSKLTAYRGGRFGVAPEAAADAAAALALESDVDAVGEAIREGTTIAARTLVRLPSDKVAAVLVDALRSDVFDEHIAEALRPYGGQTDVRAALAMWLSKFDKVADRDVVLALELAGEWRLYESRRTVVLLLDPKTNVPHMLRWQVAVAGAKLGDREALRVLLEYLKNPPYPGVGSYPHHAVGRMLNEVVGMDIYKGAQYSDGTHETNYLEVLPKFRAWFDEHGDRLWFDEGTGKWLVR